jgi:hypothetical protein
MQLKNFAGEIFVDPRWSAAAGQTTRATWILRARAVGAD